MDLMEAEESPLIPHENTENNLQASGLQFWTIFGFALYIIPLLFGEFALHMILATYGGFAPAFNIPEKMFHIMYTCFVLFLASHVFQETVLKASSGFISTSVAAAYVAVGLWNEKVISVAFTTFADFIRSLFMYGLALTVPRNWYDRFNESYIETTMFLVQNNCGNYYSCILSALFRKCNSEFAYDSNPVVANFLRIVLEGPFVQLTVYLFMASFLAAALQEKAKSFLVERRPLKAPGNCIQSVVGCSLAIGLGMAITKGEAKPVTETISRIFAPFVNAIYGSSIILAFLDGAYFFGFAALHVATSMMIGTTLYENKHRSESARKRSELYCPVMFHGSVTFLLYLPFVLSIRPLVLYKLSCIEGTPIYFFGDIILMVFSWVAMITGVPHIMHTAYKFGWQKFEEARRNLEQTTQEYERTADVSEQTVQRSEQLDQEFSIYIGEIE